MSELVNWFDGLVKTGGGRVAYAFYGNNEFELCTDTNAITLHADFAAFLKFSTTIAASACVSSYLDPGTLAVLARGYVVTVLGHSVRGIEYPVEEVHQNRRVEERSKNCKTPPHGLAVRVYVRELDNSLTLAPIDPADEFQVVFDVDV